MKKNKRVKRRKPGAKDPAKDSRVQLDGIRTGLNYLIGPDSDPRFDYSQRIGPFTVDRGE
ncbi:MAG: hypothetical protein AAB928_01370 [Patescibacteria group bacterium]